MKKVLLILSLVIVMAVGLTTYCYALDVPEANSKGMELLLNGFFSSEDKTSSFTYEAIKTQKDIILIRGQFRNKQDRAIFYSAFDLKTKVLVWADTPAERDPELTEQFAQKMLNSYGNDPTGGSIRNEDIEKEQKSLNDYSPYVFSPELKHIRDEMSKQGIDYQDYMRVADASLPVQYGIQTHYGVSVYVVDNDFSDLIVQTTKTLKGVNCTEEIKKIGQGRHTEHPECIKLFGVTNEVITDILAHKHMEKISTTNKHVQKYIAELRMPGGSIFSEIGQIFMTPGSGGVEGRSFRGGNLAVKDKLKYGYIHDAVIRVAEQLRNKKVMNTIQEKAERLDYLEE